VVFFPEFSRTALGTTEAQITQEESSKKKALLRVVLCVLCVSVVSFDIAFGCFAMQAHGYSLWLMPEGAVYESLARPISRLATEFSTPTFEPHVTLLGQLPGTNEEMVSKTTQLSVILPPHEIKLTTVDYLDEFFRCLFIRAEESDWILDANRIAREIFGRTDDPPFMPHLSLVYGDLSWETKERIVAEIGPRFDLTFPVTSLHLFATEGEPHGWRQVKESPLTGNT